MRQELRRERPVMIEGDAITVHGIINHQLKTHDSGLAVATRFMSPLELQASPSTLPVFVPFLRLAERSVD